MPGRGSIPGIAAPPSAYETTVANQQAQIQQAQNPYQNAESQSPFEPMSKAKAFTVDPNQLSQLNLQGQSFDPYRAQALGDINAQSASGLAGAQTQLAQTGGLGAADRMAMASRFNRDKIMGRQGALGKYAGMEAQSAADAAKANQMFNAQMMNQNLYSNQAARQQAQGLDRADDLMQRQLAASGQMSDAQMNAASGGGGLLEQLSNVFNF